MPREKLRGVMVLVGTAAPPPRSRAGTALPEVWRLRQLTTLTWLDRLGVDAAPQDANRAIRPGLCIGLLDVSLSTGRPINGHPPRLP